MGSCLASQKNKKNKEVNIKQNNMRNEQIRSKRNSLESNSNPKFLKKSSLINIYEIEKNNNEEKAKIIEIPATETEEDKKEISLKFKQKGNEFYNAKNYEKALDEYTKAIKIYNQDAFYFTNRALVFKQMKNWTMVIKDCESASKIDENNLKAITLRGIAIVEKGKNTIFSICEIEEGINLLENVRKMFYNQNKTNSELEINILKAKKILFYKEREIKQQKNYNLKVFLEKLQKTEENEEKNDVFDYLFGLLKEKNEQNIPDYYCCKISYDIMRNPILTPAGHSYEGDILKEHIQKVGFYDPVTRNYFDPRCLIMNKNINEGIKNFLNNEPWSFEFPYKSEDYNQISL